MASRICAAEKVLQNIVLIPDQGSAVLVDKSRQRIYLYTQEQGNVQKRLSFPCSTGEAFGIKSESGDKKTPEGVYFLMDEYHDRYLSPVYGKKAFPTDYPNYMDKRAGRNGSAIWLHGTSKTLKPMDSNGCIAMNNNDILALAEYIILKQTPVIIAEKIILKDQTQIDLLKNRMLAFIDLWSNALKKGDYHDYLSLYAPEYFPEISWWPQWQQLRTRVGEIGADLSFFPDNTGIYMEKDILVVHFTLEMNWDNQIRSAGTNQFFIRKHGDSFVITGDSADTSDRSIQEKPPSFLVAASELLNRTEDRCQVISFVDSWINAWSSKNMEKYRECYSEKFYSDGMTKKQWVDRKTDLAGMYSYIKVTGRDLNIKEGPRKSVVTFFQDYKSSGYSARGIKKLVLVKEEDVWKITQESWKKK
ncbi:MAG: L,D-transpeptidase [Thermodesulfobacteriota bacterium]|nr:L,D-transpeptidase [Thermodesulfobacteriota bacterium]